MVFVEARNTGAKRKETDPWRTLNWAVHVLQMFCSCSMPQNSRPHYLVDKESVLVRQSPIQPQVQIVLPGSLRPWIVYRLNYQVLPDSRQKTSCATWWGSISTGYIWQMTYTKQKWNVYHFKVPGTGFTIHLLQNWWNTSVLHWMNFCIHTICNFDV